MGRSSPYRREIPATEPGLQLRTDDLNRVIPLENISLEKNWPYSKLLYVMLLRFAPIVNREIILANGAQAGSKRSAYEAHFIGAECVF